MIKKDYPLSDSEFIDIDDKLYRHKSSTSCGISAWRDAI